MLAGLLPSDDGDVVALLERCISEKCGQPFSHLWMAAHWADRPVPGRLLEHSVELMPDSTMCFRTARRCTESEPGETVRALIAVAEMGHVETFTRLVSLSLVVTDRSAAESTHGPLTEEIPLLARKLARSYRNAHFESALTVKSFLSVLADFLDDAELRKINNERFDGYEEGGASVSGKRLKEKLTVFGIRFLRTGQKKFSPGIRCAVLWKRRDATLLAHVAAAKKTSGAAWWRIRKSWRGRHMWPGKRWKIWIRKGSCI